MPVSQASGTHWAGLAECWCTSHEKSVTVGFPSIFLLSLFPNSRSWLHHVSTDRQLEGSGCRQCQLSHWEAVIGLRPIPSARPNGNTAVPKILQRGIALLAASKPSGSRAMLFHYGFFFFKKRKSAHASRHISSISGSANVAQHLWQSVECCTHCKHEGRDNRVNLKGSLGRGGGGVMGG